MRLYTSGLYRPQTPQSTISQLLYVSLSTQIKNQKVQQRKKRERVPQKFKGKKKLKISMVKGSVNNVSDQNYGKLLILVPGNLIKMW